MNIRFWDFHNLIFVYMYPKIDLQMHESNIHRDFVLSKNRSMDIHNSIFRYSFIDSWISQNQDKYWIYLNRVIDIQNV